LASPERGLLLFVYTSALMFALRFFAGPIVHRISPLGLLCVSACFGAIGLTTLGTVNTGFALVIAATIYGVGKTFFWPTMLGVVSEQFPKGGAITIGAIGGVGMLSAGLLGGPALGYKQDYFASKNLKEAAAPVYEQYKSPTKNGFLFFPEIQGLDGSKVGAVRTKGEAARTPDEKLVHDADLYGGRTALKVTAAVPATMAACYLFLILYFKARGGYKQVHIEGAGESAKEVPEAGALAK
jgi:MFS family permease